MSYLDIARAALTQREKSEKSLLYRSEGGCDRLPDCEISEISEKRSEDQGDSPLLSAEAAEALKAQIIAAVSMEPAAFDRALYEELMAQWKAHEFALARSESTAMRPLLIADLGVGSEEDDAHGSRETPSHWRTA